MIKLFLLFLFIFTPMAMGSVELWALSVMELVILLMVTLWVLRSSVLKGSRGGQDTSDSVRVQKSIDPTIFKTAMILLALFLCLILFQMAHLPSGLTELLSPKAYELRHQLRVGNDPMEFFPLSLFPLGTKIEFFKWISLSIFFLFLLHWRGLDESHRTTRQLIVVILLMGFVESLYGMFLVFRGSGEGTFFAGTFASRNHLVGYLLMTIPLGIGFLFSVETSQVRPISHWLHRLSFLDGKTLLMGFSIIVMILGLIVSASRAAMLSLLLSLSLSPLLFNDFRKEKRLFKKSVLILGLALLWAGWIGTSALVTRFFTVSEDMKLRWAIWENTIQILKDFPLLGSGLGTFAQIFPMYRSFYFRGLVTHAENDFLQLASEVGLVGFGLLAILFLFLFFKGGRSIRAEISPQRYIGRGALTGILALMVYSLVEKNLQVPANALLYTFLWGLAITPSFQKRSGQSDLMKRERGEADGPWE
ncbi:MAG: O-antigen ligase family protein [Desulfobacterales bacterium]|nr:O-antigen ligase family protein [Desulfobacterales bacterium]